MPTSFGNYTRDEYAQLQAQLAEAQREAQRVQGLLDMSQAEQRVVEATDRIVDLARAAVSAASGEGGQVDQLAEFEIAESVVAPIINERVKKIVEELKEKRMHEALDKLRDPDWVTEKSEKYNQMFQTDGTYKEIDEKARAIVLDEICENLRSQREKMISEELASPERIQEAMLAAEVLVKKELDDYREERIRGLPDRLREKAKSDGMKKIDDELATQYEAQQNDATTRWLNSNDAARYRYSKEIEASDAIEKVARAKGRAHIDDEFRQKQEIFDTYLSGFITEGINLELIPKGWAVKIELGEAKRADNPRRGYQGQPDYIYKFQGTARVMELVSQGDGMFYVDTVNH